MAIKYCKRIWNHHGFSILFISIIVFFIVYWFLETRFQPNGSYSTSYYYNPHNDVLSPTFSNKKKSTIGTSKGEKVCKDHIESIFKLPFEKCRPSFLYNSVTGENLELDMYNNDLKIAVEYNGRQHYEFVPYFHQTRDRFQTQKYRDIMKAELCKKNRILLITVPYTISLEKIPSYINSELKKYGVLI